MFHLITGAIMGFVAIYIFARCIAPLNLALSFKLLAFMVLFAAAFKLQLMRFLVGSLSSAVVPVWLLAFTGWVFAAVIVLAFLLLARDFCFFVLFAARGFTSTPGFLSAGQWSVILLTSSMLISAFGTWQALRVPPVHKIEIVLPDLPEQLDGMRIVQLTDLHIGSIYDGAWLSAIVDKVNGLKPDMIAITGDFVDGDVRRLAPEVAPLAKLRAGAGVFACVGNHEYYSGYGPWTKALQELGIKLLLNEHMTIKYGEQSVVIAGVTDSVASSFGLPTPDIKKALAGSPENVTRILLAHRPSGAESYAAEHVSLQLSGHTHGGQIWPLSLAVERFNDGFISGLYHVGAMALYLSPGTGLWGGFPVRLGVPSEISELTLRAKQSQ